MVTNFKGILQNVTGSISMAFFLFICTFMSMGIFLIRKDNRNRRNILKYFVVEMGILEVCDYFWFAYFFAKGEYINRGMRGVWLIFIFPLLLFVANLFFVVKSNKKI